MKKSIQPDTQASGTSTPLAGEPSKEAFLAKASSKYPQLSILKSSLVRIRHVPGVFWGLLSLITLMGILSPRSIEPRHLLYLIRQGAAMGLVAIGQTIVIISGGLDLSVGSIVIFSDVLAAQMIAGQEERVLPVILLVLGVGAAIGLVNGLVVSRLRVSPFIATLGMNLIVQGAALIYSGGAPRGSIPANMRFWGNGFFVQIIPAAVLIWLPAAILGHFFLRRTVPGRRIVGFGANPRAAELAGVRTHLTQILSYSVSGLMAAAGGLLLVAYVGVGTLEVGTDFLLGSIAAAIIGGTPFEGGRGTMAGTVGGVLFLMSLYSILTIINLPVSGRRIVEGLMILIALTLYAGDTD